MTKLVCFVGGGFDTTVAIGIVTGDGNFCRIQLSFCEEYLFQENVILEMSLT